MSSTRITCAKSGGEPLCSGVADQNSVSLSGWENNLGHIGFVLTSPSQIQVVTEDDRPDMNMAEHLLVEQIKEAFVGCELPEYFTEHEPDSCWQCADVELALRHFVRKWEKKRLFMRGLGTDLLFLNIDGFKFLAPRLVGFALSGLPGSDELMSDVVEAYGLNVLEQDQGYFNERQKESLKNFALSELIAHRQKFMKLGFDDDEIDDLKRRWRSIRV